MKNLKKVLGACLAAAVVAVAVPASATPGQKPDLTNSLDVNSSGTTHSADRGVVTDISARRHHRRQHGRYHRPRHYQPYGYARPYRPYGYHRGYHRRPGVYMGF